MAPDRASHEQLRHAIAWDQLDEKLPSYTSGGDEVHSYVAVTLDANKNPYQAIFTVRDYATNITKSTGQIPMLPGPGGVQEAISKYYDGTEGGFFSEVSPGGYSLRKPAEGNTEIFLAHANGQELTSFPVVDVTTALNNGNVTLQDTTYNHSGPVSTSNPFYNTFHHCSASPNG